MVAAFVIAGAIILLVMRNNAYNTLREKHDVLLTGLSQQLTEDIDDTAEDVRHTASAGATRRYALAANSRALVDSDVNNTLVADFLDLIETNLDRYAAIRYIDAAGELRLEVVNDMQSPVVNSVQGARNFNDDSSFNRALNSEPQEVFMSAPFTQSEVNGSVLPEPISLYRLAVPVRYRDSSGVPLGVLQLDVYASAIMQTVSNAPQSAVYGVPERRFIILNADGQYLLDTETGTVDDLYALRPQTELDALLQGTNTRLSEGSGLVVSTERLHLPVETMNTPWKLAVVDNAGTLLGEFHSLILLVLAGSVVSGLVVAIIISRVVENLVAPLDRARVIARRISEERMDAAAVAASGDDDFLNAIQHMSSQLNDLSQTMQIQRRRLSRNLEIAARVSRESAMLNNLDQLLKRVLELICNEYGFYHAQIFLLDDVGKDALLAYSHGEAGQKMLDSKHRLPVGSVSVVGGVTARGEAVIVDDTARQGAEHAFNPLLPHTRAEMGLPLQVGGEVIGALDIQSVNPNAFTEDDVQVLQLLADQLALAIYNGRLLVQSQGRVEQIDRLNRQLTSTAWEQAQESFGLEHTYHYDLREIKEGTDEDGGEVVDPTVSVPIRIRGQVVGAMDIAMPEGEELSEVDDALLGALTDRLSLVLENARLFQETQLTLNETSTLYDISSSINEVDSLVGVIQVIIGTVMPGASSGQILEFNERPFGVSPEWLTITAGWSAEEQEWSQEFVGRRLNLTDYPFLAALEENTVTLVTDVAQDSRLDEKFRTLLQGLNARALAIVPLNMRGLWRAVLMVEFDRPRRFSDQDNRIYTALIDQAGTAVDNRLLMQQTEQTLELRERMYAAGRAINTAESFGDLIMAMMITSGEPDLNFALSLLEGSLGENGWPETERLVVRTNGDGEIEDINEARPLALAADSALYHYDPEVTTDQHPDEPPASSLIAEMRAQGIAFRAIFPLFSDDRPSGLFYVMHPQPIRMSLEDFEYYQALTSQMSTALQKRRLLEQTEQALEEASLLYAASRAITASLDLNAVYNVVVDYLVSASNGIHHIAVLLAERDAAEATYAYSWTHGKQDERAGQVVAAEDVPYLRLARDYQDQETISFNSVATKPELGLQSVGSLTIAPLQFRQQWFGLLIVESAQNDVFDERLNRFIQAVSDQIAISLENSRLLD
ncbi:MAG: GAF domain-containing protein, partial [Anaerolineae bacterium]|nr:GAF domain-containing protein [Anaerolineae bacterium]